LDLNIKTKSSSEEDSKNEIHNKLDNKASKIETKTQTPIHSTLSSSNDSGFKSDFNFNSVFTFDSSINDRISSLKQQLSATNSDESENMIETEERNGTANNKIVQNDLEPISPPQIAVETALNEIKKPLFTTSDAFLNEQTHEINKNNIFKFQSNGAVFKPTHFEQLDQTKLNNTNFDNNSHLDLASKVFNLNKTDLVDSRLNNLANKISNELSSPTLNKLTEIAQSEPKTVVNIVNSHEMVKLVHELENQQLANLILKNKIASLQAASNTNINQKFNQIKSLSNSPILSNTSSPINTINTNNNITNQNQSDGFTSSNKSNLNDEENIFFQTKIKHKQNEEDEYANKITENLHEFNDIDDDDDLNNDEVDDSDEDEVFIDKSEEDLRNMDLDDKFQKLENTYKNKRKITKDQSINIDLKNEESRPLLTSKTSSTSASPKTPKSALLERRRKAVFELLIHDTYPSDEKMNEFLHNNKDLFSNKREFLTKLREVRQKLMNTINLNNNNK